MKTKKKVKKLFPIDFYGEDGVWKFVIRANNTTEVFDALMWRSYLSLRREEYNLLHLAVEMFPYECDSSNGPIAEFSGAYGCLMRVKMLGPIVEVSTLNKAYLEKRKSASFEFAAA